MREGRFALADGAEMYFRLDDFSEPWRDAPAILMVHGFGEASDAWHLWVPHFVRDYRVYRVDRRGFGRSTPMPEDFAWSLDGTVADIAGFIEGEIKAPVHLVVAKVSTPVGIRLTAQRPDLVRSLSIPGGLVQGPQGDPWADHIAEHGPRHWAEATMDNRLGPDTGVDEKGWWIDMTARTAASTMIGFLRTASAIDVTGDLASVSRPTLVIATENPRRPVAETQAWQSQIPGSKLIEIPSSGYHVAATNPDDCAREVRAFIDGVD